ncbi:MAG: putative quinol monooxygenase [Victivallaceae bacterium]|nr:putative quinol monooxygenase [Victivallaceae bacterium]
MIQLVVVLNVKPEYSNTIQEAMRPLVEASRKEAGNISYELVRDTANPDTFLFLEQWESDAILERHGKTPHFVKYCGEMDKMCNKSVLHRIER